MSPNVIYLFGPPAVGKFTIASAIAERIGAVVVDNQLINRPIFALFKWDGRFQLPEDIMDRVVPIRDAVLSTIEEAAPESMSYVFTNTLSDSEDSTALYERIRRIAVRRRSVFVPVTVTCEPGEQARRVANADRATRLKIADPAWVRDYMKTTRPFEPDDPDLVRMDSTAQDPKASAEEILRTAAGRSPLG